MSYNWKCCSFYPNNFDASALGSFQRTRGFIKWNKKVHLMEQEGSFNGTNKATGCIQQLLSAARGFYLLNAKVQLYYNRDARKSVKNNLTI